VKEAQLSKRESQILNLASEGLIDIQIALKLGITPSTVSSYWVRMRGKVGQFSRTELVANHLRSQAELKIAPLQKQIENFEKIVSDQSLILDEVKNAQIYRAGLDSIAEPLLLLNGSFYILYANLRFRIVFGYKDDELRGNTIDSIWVNRAEYLDIERFVRLPEPSRFGVEKFVFARKNDGDQVKVVVLLQAIQTSEGTIISAIFRTIFDSHESINPQI
jgi:PAS domain S-box-containing protein